jgi:hypothetical protein
MCVIYLHGNCGSRIDGLDVVNVLAGSGVPSAIFDFSGSGNSDG